MQPADADAGPADQGGAKQLQDGKDQRILDGAKMANVRQEMEVHENSKIYTHFF